MNKNQNAQSQHGSTHSAPTGVGLHYHRDMGFQDFLSWSSTDRK